MNTVNREAAEAYEKEIVPTLNGPLAETLVDAAKLRPGERVLDVACGTGIVMRGAAPRLAPGGAITGLDLDPAMIAVAQSLVRDPGGVSIDWHCASAQEMPLEDATFDVVLCVQGLQYLPDCAAGLAEMRRVLKPSGRMLSVVWTTLEACKGQLALATALERRGIDVAPIHKAYSFGDPGRVRKLASEAGFGKVETRIASGAARFASPTAFVEAFAAGSPSSRAAIAKVPQAQRAEFFGEIDAALRQYADGGGSALPIEYLLLTARA